MQAKPVQTWLVLQALAWLPVLAIVSAGLLGDPLPRKVLHACFVGIAISFAALVVVLRSWRTPADLVTCTRVALVLAAATLATQAGRIEWPVWILLGISLLLDVVDGWCARRSGSSAEGAILDLEADQFAFLTLALLAFALAGAMAVVFVLPGLRLVKVTVYGLLGVSAASPRPRSGDNRLGKVWCALASALVFASLIPGLSRPLVNGTTLTAALVLLWSYRTDLSDLIAAKRSQST